MQKFTYNSVEDALQHANQRIDILIERVVRQEAALSAHMNLLIALVNTHPELDSLREVWLRASSVSIASSKIHEPEDISAIARSEETSYQCEFITTMIDDIIADDRDEDG